MEKFTSFSPEWGGWGQVLWGEGARRSAAGAFRLDLIQPMDEGDVSRVGVGGGLVRQHAAHEGEAGEVAAAVGNADVRGLVRRSGDSHALVTSAQRIQRSP